jgi:hypothetical protein
LVHDPIDVFLQVHEQPLIGRMALQCAGVTGREVVAVSAVQLNQKE